MGNVSQKVKVDAESPTPIQLDEPNLVTRMGERSTLQSSCQSTSNVDSKIEVTSPLKTRHWAQMQEERAELAAAQEANKNQKAKGRIKKIAHEKGLTQRKEKQALGPSSGTKRQIALFFTEKELENVDNLAKKRKCTSLACIDHGVYNNDIASVAHVVHNDIAYVAKNEDANEVQNGVALGVHYVTHGIHYESDISAVAAAQHRREP